MRDHPLRDKTSLIENGPSGYLPPIRYVYSLPLRCLLLRHFRYSLRFAPDYAATTPHAPVWDYPILPCYAHTSLLRLYAHLLSTAYCACVLPLTAYYAPTLIHLPTTVLRSRTAYNA